VKGVQASTLKARKGLDTTTDHEDHYLLGKAIAGERGIFAGQPD
jgi:hypothetical protein